MVRQAVKVNSNPVMSVQWTIRFMGRQVIAAKVRVELLLVVIFPDIGAVELLDTTGYHAWREPKKARDNPGF